jgi:hypothetical protein
MSQSNTNIGVNLTTVNAGNIMPIQSNASGYIAPTCFYTQISTCTTASNNYSLPNNPILGQIYTIRNDGASVAIISAGSTNSTINGISSANGASGTYLLGGEGGTAAFIAISSNGIASTSASTASANNPLIVWHSVLEANNPIQTFTVLNTATTASAGSALSPTNFDLVSGTTYIIPAMAGTCAVTLPANAGSVGVNYTFRMTGTVGNAMTFTAATANTIKGVYNLSGGTVIKAAATTCVITATAVAGDVLTLQCDGTYWYVTGIGSAAASFS